CPSGWHIWDGNFALNTLVYREYSYCGAGPRAPHTFPWRGFSVITSSAEAASYTPGAFIAGGNWLSGTGCPSGWHIWDGNFALNTLVYREYRNT
ncbi:pectinesterase family protein, partial [Escherichia coli]|uniref:pectinesterase family protein n=1 Tax=Escherichia coli TaxID=562 RepID=UPI0012D19452|nr:hypothetical protein [Escherichia coli]